MTGADLKTIREACGLSVRDLADLTGVQERTVRYWESGRSGVPEDVASLVERLDALLDTLRDRLVKDTVAHHGAASEDIALLRYRDNADLWHFVPDFRPYPATTHGALLARCRAALANLHIATRIVYMDPNAYERWLDGRFDCDKSRVDWVKSTP